MNQHEQIWNVSNLSTVFAVLHTQLHGFNIIFHVLSHFNHHTKVRVIWGITDFAAIFCARTTVPDSHKCGARSNKTIKLLV